MTLSHQQFIAWNPAVSSDCTQNFWGGSTYCVGVVSSVVTSTSVTSPRTKLQDGCDNPEQAYYDGGFPATATCFMTLSRATPAPALSHKFGITHDPFLKWNPAIAGTARQTSGLTSRYCVGVCQRALLDRHLRDCNGKDLAPVVYRRCSDDKQVQTAKHGIVLVIGNDALLCRSIGQVSLWRASTTSGTIRNCSFLPLLPCLCAAQGLVPNTARHPIPTMSSGRHLSPPSPPGIPSHLNERLVSTYRHQGRVGMRWSFRLFSRLSLNPAIGSEPP